MNIIAAIPCYNEGWYIGSTVLMTKKFVNKVIVIDDGSVDDSAEIAVEAGAIVYKHGQNKGYGKSICDALAMGRRADADILVTLDADGQHNPDDIPEMVKPLLNGEADVVVGSRFLGAGTKPPLYRRVGQHILTFFTNLGTGGSLTDSQSGFRAYSSKALRELGLSERGMSVSSEIQFAIAKGKLRVAEVPINVTYFEKSLYPSSSVVPSKPCDSIHPC